MKGIDYWTVLAYNFDSFKQNYKKNNPDRQVRQYMRENKDISELKSYLIHTAEKIRLIDDGRYVDIGNSIKNFKERYTIFLDDGRRVEFYIPFFFEDYDNRYTAHMQFPDRRIPINFQFKTVSAKKIVKAVDEFILSHTEDFSKLHDVTVLWKSASESIRALNEKKSVKEHTMLPADYHSELDKTAKDTFCNNIQDIIAKDSYYLQGRLSLKYLLDNFSDNIYHMCTNYDYAYRHKE